MRNPLAGLLLACLATACAATAVAGGGFAASNARINPAHEGQFETWAYASIGNAGKADAIIAVSSPDAASVVLRATTPSDAGRKVRSVASIPVPAGGTLVLSADTWFIAFIQPRHSYAPGQSIKATIRFASGAQLPVEFVVSDTEGNPGDAATQGG